MMTWPTGVHLAIHPDHKSRGRVHVDPSHSLGSPTSGLPLVHVTRSTSPAHFFPRFLLESFKPRRATEEEDEGGGDAGDDEGDESTRQRNPRQARSRARARKYASFLLPARERARGRRWPGGVCARSRGSASRRRERDGGTGEGRGGADRCRLPRPTASRCGDRRVRVWARISCRSSRSHRFLFPD